MMIFKSEGLQNFEKSSNTHLQNKQLALKFNSSLNFKDMLQNFLYSYKKKTQVLFFVFHFEQLSFPPYECPGL